MRLLLGFGNKARQGKDTAAEAIVEQFERMGVPAISVPFAGVLRTETNDAIRQAGGITQLLNWPLPDGTEIPTYVTADPAPVFDSAFPFGKHPKLLQWWGTEYRRAQDPDYFVKKAFERLKEFKGIVVIPDVRFVNEFKAIKEHGGYTVQIRRLNENGSPFIAVDRDPLHISEIGLDGADWDFFIKVKTGQSELLRDQALSISNYLLKNATNTQGER